MTDIRAQLEELRLEADSLRARAAEIEQDLAGQQVKGRARDGAIIVTVTGLGTITDVQISPGLIGRTAGDDLGELVVTAAADARGQAAQLASEAYRALTTDGEPVEEIAPDWLKAMQTSQPPG
jgi:DNA-binding protein YbaB